MQRPNVPQRNVRAPMTPRSYVYAVYTPPAEYGFKDYNGPVLLQPHQQQGQRLPYSQVQTMPGYQTWEYPTYKTAVFTPQMTQHAPVAPPAPQKKMLDIIDPNTGEKVDLSKVAVSSKKNDPVKEQIRAQFASKVAAVATPRKTETEEKNCMAAASEENPENGFEEEEEEERQLEIEQTVEKVIESEDNVQSEEMPEIVPEPVETPSVEKREAEATPVKPEIVQKVTEVQPVQQKVAEVQPVQQKVTEVQPVQQKVVEVQPVQQKVVEVQPVQKATAVVAAAEPAKESEEVEENKGDSDSEWKETKRNKKKKKVAKLEQQQQVQHQPQTFQKGNSNQQFHQQQRQQKQVVNGTAQQSQMPAKDQPQQPQPVKEAPKEPQPKVVPAPVKPVPVWPMIRSNLVPSNPPQASKPPQPVGQPQPVQKPPQQKPVQHQGSRQQHLVKQQQVGVVPVKQPTNAPTNKQQSQPPATASNNEQKAGGKKKSKEKNKNKKIAEVAKPKTPEPPQVEEAVSTPEVVALEQTEQTKEAPVEAVPLEDKPVEEKVTPVECQVIEQVVVEETKETTVPEETKEPSIEAPVAEEAEPPVLPEEVQEAAAEDRTEEKEVAVAESFEVAKVVDVVEENAEKEQPAEVEKKAEEKIEDLELVEAAPAGDDYDLEEGEIVDDEDEESEKAQLLFKYSENQWSPANPEGTKKYDRDFLLQIQQSVKLNRPSLPDLDIVLKEPHMKNVSGSTPTVGAPADFTGYVRQNSNSYNTGGRSQRSGQHRQGGYDNRRVIDFKIQENVTLHKSEDAWQKHRTSDKDESTKLFNGLRGVLNKLTPQHFDTLMEQVKELSIDSESKLAGCISLLFEQCIKQPIFSGLYAKMGKCFSLLTVPSNDDPTKTVTFRKLLLTKCQQEFEQDKENEKEIMCLSEMIESAGTEEEKKLLEVRKSEAMVAAKRRSLGNIRFIGELFKLTMLTENIMHECLSKLLKGYEDEDNIECLCKLLTTIGKDIDSPKSKFQSRVEAYFGEMRRLVDEKKTTTRIRFMMMDVIDLRKGGWMPKRNEGPKTIEQIHKEAEKEKMEVQKRIEDHRMPRRQNSKHANMSSSNAEDGWTNVSRPPKSQAFDASKIKLTRMDDNVQLGPGRSSWNKGSTLGVAKEQQLLMPSNRYSLLSGSTEEPSSRSFGSSSREQEKYPGRQSGFASLLPERPPSEERTAPKEQTPSSEERAHSTDGRAQASAPSAPMVDNKDLEIPREDMEKKIKSRVEEYLMLKDIKEAIETVKELNTESCFKNAVRFFYSSIEQNIEKSAKIREEVGLLHMHVLKNRAAPFEAYAAALKKMTRFADDLVVDVPQVWKYIGEAVSPVFLEGSNFKLNILVPEPVGSGADDSDNEFDSPDDDNTARLLAVVLNAVSHKMGHHQASELWESSGLKWEEFVRCQPVPEFLKKFKVDYTVESTDVGKKRQRLISVNENKNELIALFSKPDSTLEDIHDWIFENMHLTPQNTGNPADLKSVSDCCTALCMSCLHKRSNSALNEYDLDEERMKQYLCVIKTLTLDRQERQLEVLFGLQELFHRLSYPKDLLHRLFELLFDAEVLNETAFHQWREDTTRTVGKGVAISSVSRFYNWIVEEEKD